MNTRCMMVPSLSILNLPRNPQSFPSHLLKSPAEGSKSAHSKVATTQPYACFQLPHPFIAISKLQQNWCRTMCPVTLSKTAQSQTVPLCFVYSKILQWLRYLHWGTEIRSSVPHCASWDWAVMDKLIGHIILCQFFHSVKCSGCWKKRILDKLILLIHVN